ncbi:hypothetical protein VPHD51_0219 [Vibrio phage D51]
MVTVQSTVTPKQTFITLNDDNYPDDGAYKVIATSDPDDPKVILIVNESVIFSDGFSLQEVCNFTALDYYYSLERCHCSIQFTD